MVRTRIVLFTCVGLAVIAAEAVAAAVTIQPPIGQGDDVSLYKRTNLPLSSGFSLYAINTGPPGPGQDDFVSLIAFDVSGASLNANDVVSANLHLYENNVPTASFVHPSPTLSNQITVQAAGGPWSPTTTFFNTIPDPVPGLATTTVVDSIDTWFQWDVTEIVKGWLDASFDNNGFIVTSSVETRTPAGIIVGSAFDSFELTNRPRLEIEVIPEPSTLTLLGIGVAVCLACRTLRKLR